MNEVAKKIFTKIENSPSVMAIRSGLVMIIPILLIGSMCLVLQGFPIHKYQVFINYALDGNIYNLLNFIYNATFGMGSVFLTITISFCYTRKYSKKRNLFTAPLVSLMCFFILCGVLRTDVSWDALGVKGMFIAIVAAILASKLLLLITDATKGKLTGYSDGSDIDFNDAVYNIIPVFIVISIFAIVSTLITYIFNVDSFFELFVRVANALFIPLGRTFLSGILFVIATSILWFFGIHGSNVLETVASELFVPAIDTNIQLVANRLEPTEILTKPFFDVFILMGGCGCTISLLVAILVFSKKYSNRRLSKLAAVPMVFNVSELMVFGLPVILNPIMLIPFILTPVACFLTTFIAMKTGIVPLVISDVNWTTPVIISGYVATGSIAGSILQVVNIIMGALIYRPFILQYDKRRDAKALHHLKKLINIIKKSEETVSPVTLTELTDELGGIARFLTSDLRYALLKEDISIYYQPQYNNKKECIGMEALIRWNHPAYGMIYPPLVVQLARESKLLTELESYVFKKSISDYIMIKEQTGFSGKISINISTETLQSKEYMKLLEKNSSLNQAEEMSICLEITEQTALLTDNKIFDTLLKIKKLGYKLAIDDFSMGHTSITYLQNNQFDVVKLDGKLVIGMINNPRSFNIVKSIVELSHSLGFSVIAEYVEDKKQMQMLEEIGCVQYQGYLFSPAIECEELIIRLKKELGDHYEL